MPITASNIALKPSKFGGYPNQGPWDTTLTDYATSPQELFGVRRQEGPNYYMYVQFGTGAVSAAGVAMKVQSGLTDLGTNAIIAPFQLTQLGATAAGYFSAVGVTVSTVPSGQCYGWICYKGIGTLPLNSNTAGLAMNTPIAPSSSSATFAECAVASAVGRTIEPLGATLGTATQTARGGNLCMFDFEKFFAVPNAT